MTPPSSPGGPSVAAGILLLVLDVDGVLTDGSIYLDDQGHETKRFNIRDGLGLRVWMRLGLKAAIITGRCGAAVQHRMAELGIGEVVQGSQKKGEALRELCARTGIPLEHTACLADDWPDLPMMRLVGYPMAVADADQHVREAARFSTKAIGGHGAAREAIEHLLAAKGLLDRALALYEEGPAASPNAG